MKTRFSNFRKCHFALSCLTKLLVLSAATKCKKYGSYHGSEDGTIWRDGLVLQTSGLFPKIGDSGGLIFGVDVRNNEPALTTLEMLNMPKPSKLSFRPHGLYLDNSSSLLYTVCHDDLNKQESIAVFDVQKPIDSSSLWPVLVFKYVIVSPHFQWHAGQSGFWMLNDVAVVDGQRQLFTTQLGPQPKEQGTQKDKYLWQCVWNDADAQRGTLPATCSKAWDEASYGLNGITLDQSTRTLYVNDQFIPQLLVFQIHRQGAGVGPSKLTKLGVLPLVGVVDNVEHDLASGQLQMGLIGERSDLVYI